MRTYVEAIEYFLPEKVVSNADLVSENPKWNLDGIEKKTGVLKRHIASENETAYDLSYKACKKLFKYYDKNQIDCIIYCTQTPDYIMPSNSFLLHKDFQMKDSVFTFDINHACAGYIYCLAMADSFIKTGMANEILIINAETYSKYIHPRDRSTRILFGDGATASIIRKSKNENGLIDISLGSSGKNYENFIIPAGGHRIPRSDSTSKEFIDDSGNVKSQNNILMDGLGLLSFINSKIPKHIDDILQKNELKKSQIDRFIFHQASKITLNSLKKIMGLRNEQVFININYIGNTVSSSIPIALKKDIKQKPLLKGSLVILSGFGVGLSYGTALLKI